MSDQIKQHPLYEFMNSQDEAVEVLKKTYDPMVIVSHLLTFLSPDRMIDFPRINQLLGPLIEKRAGHQFRIWFRDNTPEVKLFHRVLSDEPGYALLKEKSLDESPRYFDSACKRIHYEGRLDEIQTIIRGMIEPNRVIWQSKMKPHWSDSCCMWYDLVSPEIYDADFLKYRVNAYAYLAAHFIERTRDFYALNKKRCNSIEIKKWQDIFQHLVRYTQEDDLKGAWEEIHSIATSAFGRLNEILTKNHNWQGFGLESETKNQWVEKIKYLMILSKWVKSTGDQDKQNIEKVLSSQNLWAPTPPDDIRPIEWVHPDISILYYLLNSHAAALKKSNMGLFKMVSENRIFIHKDSFINYSGLHHQQKYKKCKNDVAKKRIDQLYEFLEGE